MKNMHSVIFSCSHIARKFDQTEVLKDVSFTIAKGERIGLVGANGSGKSTLLKIMTGLLEKDSGVLSRSKSLKMEYLPQVHLEETGQSGGEIAKKILRSMTASSADLFLLDEPTNNLDEDGLTMLENFIGKSGKAFLIVSHDRMFLDHLVSKVVEIDSKTKSSAIYDGNYSSYIEARAAKIERLWDEYGDKVEKVQKLTDSVKEKVSRVREIESVRFGNRHLPKNEKEKPQAAKLRDREAKAGRRARVMKDRLEKYLDQSSRVTKPHQGLPLKVIFEMERGGTKIFDLKGIEKTIGRRKIGPLDLQVSFGDRLHLTGKNGSGKTTLLKILLGEMKPDQGLLERGENVIIGYISQERWLNRSRSKVMDHFLEAAKIPETRARELLNRFRITTEDVKKDLSSLSPGEYSRLLVAELVALKPNAIILDEPSNHLDLEVLEELEKGLAKYAGTLIIVSHDRYFVGKIKLTNMFNLDKYSGDADLSG